MGRLKHCCPAILYTQENIVLYYKQLSAGLLVYKKINKCIPAYLLFVKVQMCELFVSDFFLLLS